MVDIIELRTGSRTTNCKNCDSQLRYMPSEVFTEKRNYDYLGDYDIVNVISCPACGKTTLVKGR